MLVAVAVTVYVLAFRLPAAIAAETGWSWARASAYSTADSPGEQGCPGAGPLRDDTRTFASLIVPCGAVVRFCIRGRGCVTARRTDSGPFAGGRSFDLALGTVRALGYPTAIAFGAKAVRWRRLR